MQSLSSRARLALTLAALLSVALLSACPPPWDRLERPPEPGVGPAVEPDDDAGRTPKPDGGVFDAGAPVDGGDADAGAPGDAGLPADGGVDAGSPLDAGFPVDAGVPLDAGFPVDAGAPLDAGPTCVMPPVSGTDWTCLTSGTAGFADCPASTQGPVVSIVVQCPETFVLHSNGVIESLNGGALAPVVTSCVGANLAPPAFSDFDVRGTRAILWNAGFLPMCFADLATGACSCGNTGNFIGDARLATDDRVVASFDDGTIREAGFAPVLGSPETLVTSIGQIPSLVTVTRDDDTYLIGAYSLDRQAFCFDRTGIGATESAACAGSNSTDPPWSTFTDAEEQRGRQTRVHGYNPVTGVVSEQVTDGDNAIAPLIRQRLPTIEPFFEALSFSARGVLSTASSRIAVGHTGGVRVSSGVNGNFEPAPLLPARVAEFGAIRDLTFGRNATTNTPNSTLWAVADTGIWVTIPTLTAVPRPEFALEFAFGTTPASAEVVILNEAQVLVVGELSGVIHLFDILPGAPNPTLALRTTLPQISTSGSTSFIPEAILGVSLDGWSHVVVLTTGDEVWGASFNGATPPPNGMILRAQNRFKGQLGVPTGDGRYSISQRVPIDPLVNAEHVFVTAKGTGSVFGTQRYAISADAGGGENGFSIQQVGARTSIISTPGTAEEFRFFFDDADGSSTTFWTTNDGSVVSVPYNGNNLALSLRSVANPTTVLIGGAFAIQQAAGCAIAFAAETPEYFAFPIGTNSTNSFPPIPVPGGIQVNAVVSFSDSLAIAAGNGGHIFQVAMSDIGGCSVEVTDLSSAQNRITEDVVQLKWRRADELIAADADGRIWVVHIP